MSESKVPDDGKISKLIQDKKNHFKIGKDLIIEKFWLY